MRIDEEKSEPGMVVWVCNRIREVRQPDGTLKDEPFPCRNKKGEFTRSWNINKNYDGKGKIKVSYIPVFDYLKSSDRADARESIEE